MRIVITGADGFIGKNLRLRLSELGHADVMGITRATPPQVVQQALATADFVFHLGGVNRPQDPAEFAVGNAGLTQTVCDALAATKRHVPLLLASSTQALQSNPYGRSKLAAEDAVRGYGAATGAAVHIFRLPNVFGKWCKPNYNSAVATFCHNIARGLPIQVNDPAAPVTLVYVDDVIERFVQLMDGAGAVDYQLTAQLWRKLSWIPSPLGSAVAAGIKAVPPNSWNNAAAWLPVVKRHPALAGLGNKLHKAAGVLASKSVDALYLGLVSQVQTPTSWVKCTDGFKEPPTKLNGNQPNLDGLNDVERMMALDAVTYLPDDILCKVDRASMGVSLEGRTPFLDHRLFEFAWQLPLKYKLRDGQTKWPLRQVLYRHVSKELIERPKMGFGIPLHDWLRGPLKVWAEELIDAKRLEKEGYFYAAPIRTMWEDHLSGKRNWAHHLWSILMFQAWLEQQ